MKRSKFTFVDLFAGIGGFRMALESIGGHCVGFSEIASDAIASYCTNYHENPKENLGDITKLNSLPPHDILTAGVPCQSWSIAGRNLGFDDSRGQLWNDTLFLLNKAKPKAFIFENVKGLADPRNKYALNFIMGKIKEAGYYASYYLLNAYDYGVPQNRIRIYIIGFKDQKFHDRFTLPPTRPGYVTLKDIISGENKHLITSSHSRNGQSISVNANGLNDYFLFNDLRGGETTIHSWDLINTTSKEKRICTLLLQNRRKRIYGPLDGNPLSLRHFQELDPTISQDDIDGLVHKSILKAEKYQYQVDQLALMLNIDGVEVLSKFNLSKLNIDELKNKRELKLQKISAVALLEELEKSGMATCTEIRYDFKNTKISTGLNGINRIFLPNSSLYPTLVASDTNDFITEISVEGKDANEYKANFLNKIYNQGLYRKINKEEACAIQGFPTDFILPESRPRWMKLIGNSVAVTLIKQLAISIAETGVFDDKDYIPHVKTPRENVCQQSPFDAV